MFLRSLLNPAAFCWTKSSSCPVLDFCGLSQKTLNGFAISPISLRESGRQAQWPRRSFAFFWEHVNTVVLSLCTSTQNYLHVSRLANLSLIADSVAVSWCDASCLNRSRASCAYFSPLFGKGSLCVCIRFRDRAYLVLSDWVNCLVSPWESLCWYCYWGDNVLCSVRSCCWQCMSWFITGHPKFPDFVR